MAQHRVQRARVVTVYCKARSIAIASGYASASITLSGSTSSLTLLTSARPCTALARRCQTTTHIRFIRATHLRCARQWRL